MSRREPGGLLSGNSFARMSTVITAKMNEPIDCECCCEKCKRGKYIHVSRIWFHSCMFFSLYVPSTRLSKSPVYSSASFFCM